MKRIIHVNQHVIKANRKNNASNTDLTCKTYKENKYGNTVEFSGKDRVVYRPDKPLSCGAHVWIETDEPIVVDGETL